jgi:hypothetical protein
METDKFPIRIPVTFMKSIFSSADRQVTYHASYYIVTNTVALVETLSPGPHVNYDHLVM